MDVFMVVFRLIHFLAGVFWAGTQFFSTGLLIPTAAAAGPEGGRFLQRLVTQTRLSLILGIAGGLTILSGLAMYARLSEGFHLSWIVTGTGLTLTIGGLAAIIASALGGRLGSIAARLGSVVREVEKKGGPPSPAQMTEMKTLQERMRRESHWSAILLLVAVAAMAIARYVRI